MNEESTVSDHENMKNDMGTQTAEPREEDSETLLTKKIAELKSELEGANRLNESLQNQLFTIERFQTSDAAINFYTGFANWKIFMSVFRYLNPGDKGDNIKYWLSTAQNVSADIYDQAAVNESKKGRSRTLRPIGEFFIVMCRLRHGFPEEHLGHLCQISTSTVSRIFITWMNYMYLKLGQINI